MYCTRVLSCHAVVSHFPRCQSTQTRSSSCCHPTQGCTLSWAMAVWSNIRRREQSILFLTSFFVVGGRISNKRTPVSTPNLLLQSLPPLCCVSTSVFFFFFPFRLPATRVCCDKPSTAQYCTGSEEDPYLSLLCACPPHVELQKCCQRVSLTVARSTLRVCSQQHRFLKLTCEADESITATVIISHKIKNTVIITFTCRAS